jgi:conjugative relaxase-like TrwC/TraI family protein
MHFYRGSGAGAARYFDEGHRGAEAYYTEQSRAVVEIDTWRSGERLATTRLAEAGELARWVEGIDPLTGEVKGVIRAGGKDRQPVRFVEMVVNNPKSLSIVASQNPTIALAYDALLARQADEIARYLSRVAVTRIGPRGAQREVGNLAVETARVKHLTSREGDPHRHIHLMLNARVMTSDGTWHGLHSAALRQHIGAVNAMGSRILVTDASFRAVLRAEGYTLGEDGEINEARGAVALFSKRAAMVVANRERIEATWRAEHLGEEPTQRQRNAWDHHAWTEGRAAKGRAETPEQLSERVRRELGAAGFDFRPGRWSATVQEHSLSVAQVQRDELAERAVAVLSSERSAWSAAELTAAVEQSVASSGVLGDQQAVAELAEDVGARARARCISLLDPTQRTPTAMSRHLSSELVREADLQLNLGLAGLASGEGVRDDEAAAKARAARLGAGQAEAVGALCSTRRLECVIGPAGSGKTTMLGLAKEHLEAGGRRLAVVAPTLKSAQVAASELGAETSSLHKLLHANGWRWDELGRFSRLAPGDTDPSTGAVYRGPAERYALGANSVLVVDEAGLLTVDQANALIALVSSSGASLRFLGDPRQLGAVGRGGVMETAARWSAELVMLDEVHRFLRRQLNEAGAPVVVEDVDYAALSLRLRDGSETDRVVDELVGRGAVVVHHSQCEAAEAIAQRVAASAASVESLCVTAATNDEAAALNETVRRRRAEMGAVDDGRTVLGRDDVVIGAGDVIVTRRNDALHGVANRERWTVQAITDDGSVLARSIGTGAAREVRLDAGYVADAVQLGYVSTDYGNQGVTSEASITLLSDATSAGGLYVGVTRGRFENQLHVVAEDDDDARAKLIAALERDRADRGLDAARARAEANSLPVTDVPLRRAPEHRRTSIDPKSWRSAAELDRAERAIEAKLARGLRSLRVPRLVSDERRARLNRIDREAVVAARQETACHRSEAERLKSGRDELVSQAAADYLAARDDARVIAAGPGLLHHRASRLAAASARRVETAQRWREPRLPDAGSSDDAVVRRARDAVGRMLDPLIRQHLAEADKGEKLAVGIEAEMAWRERSHERVVRFEREAHDYRLALIAKATRDWAVLEDARAVREECIAEMAPEEVAFADAARDALLDRSAPPQPPARHRAHFSPEPEWVHPAYVERGGPELGM